MHKVNSIVYIVIVFIAKATGLIISITSNEGNNMINIIIAILYKPSYQDYDRVRRQYSLWIAIRQCSLPRSVRRFFSSIK